MTNVLRFFERAPRPVLMALPMAGALLVAGGLLVVVHVAEWEVTHGSEPYGISSAQQEATALKLVHSTPVAHTLGDSAAAASSSQAVSINTKVQ